MILRVTDETGKNHEVPHADATKECFPGETLEFAVDGDVVSGVVVTTAPDGASPVTGTRTFASATIGRYRLTLTTTAGSRSVAVQVIDRSCQDYFDQQVGRRQQGESTLTADGVRRILRSLCQNEPRFDGSTVVNLPLQNHGYVPMPPGWGNNL